ncbi:MAG TPA: hypothetical protein VNC50_07545 [Planctomycetia bacterium]|nr:hypothetical protein [Planctomycetia bacterium]
MHKSPARTPAKLEPFGFYLLHRRNAEPVLGRPAGEFLVIGVTWKAGTASVLLTSKFLDPKSEATAFPFVPFPPESEELRYVIDSA